MRFSSHCSSKFCVGVWVSMLTFLLLLPSIAFAQTDEQEHWRKQFKESGGIVFRCDPDRKDDAALQRICADASAEARLLAATGKIPFQNATGKDAFETAFEVASKGSLLLEASIRSTKGSPAAIYILLAATPYYSNAIEQGAKEGSLDAIPRSGDLVIWERDVIGASTSSTDELVLGMSNALSTNLKDFFATYIESRN